MRPYESGEKPLSKWNFNPRIPLGMRQYRLKGTVEYVADFNPRIPLGMRPVFHVIKIFSTLFQSTHPIRDATSKQIYISFKQG